MFSSKLSNTGSEKGFNRCSATGSLVWPGLSQSRQPEAPLRGTPLLKRVPDMVSIFFSYGNPKGTKTYYIASEALNPNFAWLKRSNFRNLVEHYFWVLFVYITPDITHQLPGGPVTFTTSVSGPRDSVRHMGQATPLKPSWDGANMEGDCLSNPRVAVFPLCFGSEYPQLCENLISVPQFHSFDFQSEDNKSRADLMSSGDVGDTHDSGSEIRQGVVTPLSLDTSHVIIEL